MRPILILPKRKMNRLKSVFIFVDYINILEYGNNNFVGVLTAARNDAIIDL